MIEKPSQGDVVALVTAAGEGTRLGLGPKAFLEIDDQSLLSRVVGVLSGCAGRILVGVPPSLVEKAREEVGRLAEVCPGGRSHQATVLDLFKRSAEPIVVIHHVARPFASCELLRGVIDAARKDGAAAAYLPSLSPLARYRAGFFTETLGRSEAVLFQSPQAFRREILEETYRNVPEEHLDDRATWELVARRGVPIRAVPGEETNLKITVPLDWEIACRVIAPKLRRGR